MKNKLTISIPNTCHEKWQNFTQTATGKMCGTCDTVVVDFTTMTDSDIIKFFIQRQAHTCGRFRPDQLRSYAIIPPVKVHLGYTLLKAGLFSMLMALIAKPAVAAGFTEKGKMAVPHQTELATHLEQSRADDNAHIVEGVVKSVEDNQPIAGVNVYQKGTVEGTVTDIDGRFQFPTKLNPGDVLVFSFIGFETYEYKVAEQQAETLAIQLDLQLDVQMLGAVMVEHGDQNSESIFNNLWQRVKGWF